MTIILLKTKAASSSRVGYWNEAEDVQSNSVGPNNIKNGPTGGSQTGPPVVFPNPSYVKVPMSCSEDVRDYDLSSFKKKKVSWCRCQGQKVRVKGGPSPHSSAIKDA